MSNEKTFLPKLADKIIEQTGEFFGARLANRIYNKWHRLAEFASLPNGLSSTSSSIWGRKDAEIPKIKDVEPVKIPLVGGGELRLSRHDFFVPGNDAQNSGHNFWLVIGLSEADPHSGKIVTLHDAHFDKCEKDWITIVDHQTKPNPTYQSISNREALEFYSNDDLKRIVHFLATFDPTRDVASFNKTPLQEKCIGFLSEII